MFSSGLRVSPRRVKQIGEEMAADFFRYYDQRDQDSVRQYGVSLAGEGLGPRSMLVMVEALGQMCREASNPVVELPDVAGKYSMALLESYIASREENLLREQELTHRAHLRALGVSEG
ncbi:MAG: hypothetical protein U9R25_18940 [Chloroflexota bacterium]|nr:hypothetical protein [Chloroflexota bacterium]